MITDSASTIIGRLLEARTKTVQNVYNTVLVSKAIATAADMQWGSVGFNDESFAMSWLATDLEIVLIASDNTYEP